MAIHKKVLDCFAALAMTVMLLFATPAAAQNLPERPTTPVLDQAKLLRPEQVIDIESKAEALEAKTGRTFFVATIPTLGELTIEDYGRLSGGQMSLAAALSQPGSDFDFDPPRIGGAIFKPADLD